MQPITAWADAFLELPEVHALCAAEAGEVEGQIRTTILSAQSAMLSELIEMLATIHFDTVVRKDTGYEPADVQPSEIYPTFCDFSFCVVQAFRSRLKYTSRDDKTPSIVGSAIRKALIPGVSRNPEELVRPGRLDWSEHDNWYQDLILWEQQGLLSGLWEETLFRCLTDASVLQNRDVYALTVWPRLLLALREEAVREEFLHVVANRLEIASPECVGAPSARERVRGTGEQSRRKGGRPGIPKSRKELALAAYVEGRPNREVAKILYETPRATQRNAQDVSKVLGYFVRNHPDHSQLRERLPALATHRTAQKWLEKPSKSN